MHSIISSILSYDFFCEYSPLHMCPLVGSNVEANCYSRNIDLGEIEIFSPVTLIIQAIAFIMAIVMLIQVSQKFTAVGKTEFFIFLIVYIGYIIVDIILTLGFIPGFSIVYKILTAIYVSLKVTLFVMLLFNGFLVFQWIEDGVASTLTLLSTVSISVFCGVGLIAFATFVSFFFKSENPFILFILYPGVTVAAAALYLFTQLFFILKTLKNYWAIGDLVIGVLALLIGLTVEFSPASEFLCKYTKHYIDGSFIHVVASLFGVMMIYKYWVSITEEDLEYVIESSDDNYMLDESAPLMKEKLENTEVDVLLKKEALDFLNDFKSSLEKVEQLNKE